MPSHPSPVRLSLVGGQDGRTATDGDVARALSAGETWAAAEMWRRFAPMVLRLARRTLGSPSEAEDVGQEVFWDPATWLEVFAAQGASAVINPIGDQGLEAIDVWMVKAPPRRFEVTHLAVAPAAGTTVDGTMPGHYFGGGTEGSAQTRACCKPSSSP